MVTPGDFTGTVADAIGRIEGSNGKAADSDLGVEAGAAVLWAGFKGVVLL